MRKYLSRVLLATAVAAIVFANGDGRRSKGAAVADNGAPKAETERARSADDTIQDRAERPADTSWKGVLLRCYRAFNNDRIMAVGAGSTFYILLSIFPAIAALVALYGLFADASVIAQNLSVLAYIAPAGALSLVGDELARLTSTPAQSLSTAFLLALLISLWSANAGMKAMFDALNVAYEETEKRSFVVLNATSLLFTAMAVAFLATTIGILVVAPIVFDWLGLGAYRSTTTAAIRFSLLILGTLLALACLYRFGPDRARPRWRWVTWGSAFATFFWMAASLAFSWYAQNFGSFDKTYGSLGAVAGFMTWLWLSVTIVLLGATLNCEIERRAILLGEHTTDAPPPSAT